MRRETKQREEKQKKKKNPKRKKSNHSSIQKLLRHRTRGSRCANQWTALEIVNSDTAMVVVHLHPATAWGSNIRVCERVYVCAWGCVCHRAQHRIYRVHISTVASSIGRTLNGQIKGPEMTKFAVPSRKTTSRISDKISPRSPFSVRPSRAIKAERRAPPTTYARSGAKCICGSPTHTHTPAIYTLVSGMCGGCG